MEIRKPRGILVVDVGYTNSKAVLFDQKLRLLAERKMASAHKPGPYYNVIDPEPFARFLQKAIPELDTIMPIDCIVPCAHGAAMALLKSDGALAMPIMDYMSAPPAEIVEAFTTHQPPFSEVYCGLLPQALTHGLQLFWQKRLDAAAFAQTTTILPLIQFWAFLLSGKRCSEISSLACQTMLLDVNTATPSSLAVREGIAPLLAPMRDAWDPLGPCLPKFGLKRDVSVLAGVHDSNANYLRYLAAGLSDFSLLSTGTWSICFNGAADISKLDPTRDTNTNTSVFGKAVACSRFFAGKELEIISAGASADVARLEVVQDLVRRGCFALPSFTDAGGPLPGTGGKGSYVGPALSSPQERASLAALYCALMVSCQLDLVQSQNQIIVDGPFSLNPLFMQILAQLRPAQKVFASGEHNGTATGAACLALIENGRLPVLPIGLHEIIPAGLAGLADYAESWFNQIAR